MKKTVTAVEHEERKRHIWNIWMFIFSFTFSNLISGIIYDTYVNYLQEVALSVATSFWSYYGYATFISALLLLLVPKIGYKWTLLFCPATCLLALIVVLYVDSPSVYAITTLLSLIGLQLHYAILAPFIAAHTTLKNKTKWYSRTYYIGYAGWLATTYLGGFFSVQRFAVRAGKTFEAAKKLTEYITELSPFLKTAYLQANRDVLLATAIISAVSIIPVFLIREKKSDYQIKREEGSEFAYVDLKTFMKTFANKYAVAYMCYWALINFGLGLFSPYYTVFLNRNLHIDKATSSLLVSISYIALVIFMMFTPKAVKKFGQVVTLAGVALLSIPFMLIIANGNAFGSAKIPIVGIALFLRSGLMNLGYPIDSSLSMEIVPKEMRPAYSTVINIVAGLVSILSGWYTGNYLFVEQSGYRIGYYIASVAYLVGCTILLVVFTKKYNRTTGQDDEESSENIVSEV